MFNFIICFLVGICILMLCFIIFSLGRIFELAIVVRECDEKIEELNSELAILTEWIGEYNAEEKE